MKAPIEKASDIPKMNGAEDVESLEQIIRTLPKEVKAKLYYIAVGMDLAIQPQAGQVS